MAMKKPRNTRTAEHDNTRTGGACLCAGAGPRLTALAGAALRGPAFDHFRTARVEVLRGIRAIIDERIEALSRKHERGAKVRVE